MNVIERLRLFSVQSFVRWEQLTLAALMKRTPGRKEHGASEQKRKRAKSGGTVGQVTLLQRTYVHYGRWKKETSPAVVLSRDFRGPKYINIGGGHISEISEPINIYK